MISICSQQSNYSMKRQRFYCFCILCSKRGDSYEWKTAKLHNWQNMGRQQLEKWRTQKDPTQDILFGYRPSQLTWRTWRDVLAHSFERVISDSEGEALKSGEHKNGSIVFMLTSAKTKRDLFCAQKSMVTWQQQSTILSEGCESRNNHRYAVVVQVLATQWNPCKTKTSQETENNSRKFQKPSQKPKVIRTYNLLEFGKYYEELSCNHRTTTLHRSERSGIAERAVSNKRRDISRIIAIRISDDKWWLDSMKCCCYLRNDQDLLADGKS